MSSNTQYVCGPNKSIKAMYLPERHLVASNTLTPEELYTAEVLLLMCQRSQRLQRDRKCGIRKRKKISTVTRLFAEIQCQRGKESNVSWVKCLLHRYENAARVAVSRGKDDYPQRNGIGISRNDDDDNDLLETEMRKKKRLPTTVALCQTKLSSQSCSPTSSSSSSSLLFPSVHKKPTYIAQQCDPDDDTSCSLSSSLMPQPSSPKMTTLTGKQEVSKQDRLPEYEYVAQCLHNYSLHNSGAGTVPGTSSDENNDSTMTTTAGYVNTGNKTDTETMYCLSIAWELNRVLSEIPYT
jgi:hypothetical protein